VNHFLEPSLDQLHSPLLLPDIDVLISEIEEAIKIKAPILIYGHDDVDGFTAVLVLYDVLVDLGARIFYHIPNRIKDGYFFRPELFEKYKGEGVTIVLTADFGSSNIKNFEIAKSAGMRLIVTDHHELISAERAGPTINPKRSDAHYPFRELAGVGVAYKVAQALAHRLLNISLEEFYSIKYDILGPLMLGTIADRVPLMQENRIYCRFGLDALRKTTRPVLKKLIDKVPEDQFGYGTVLNEILPLISSARENQGVDVFLVNNEQCAEEMVKTLKRQNELWQFQIRRVYDEVFSAARVYNNIVVSQLVNGPVNCLGSCATRLRDNFNRPSLIIGFSDNDEQLNGQRKSICVGELRGTEGTDLIALLKNAQDILIDFGGHRKAAGFTMHRTSFDEFVERACIYAEEKFPSPHKVENDDRHEIILDLKWPIAKIDDSFKILLPFGEGNPSPMLYDESGIIYTLDEALNPIDPARYTKILKESAGKIH